MQWGAADMHSNGTFMQIYIYIYVLMYILNAFICAFVCAAENFHIKVSENYNFVRKIITF